MPSNGHPLRGNWSPWGYEIGPRQLLVVIRDRVAELDGKGMRGMSAPTSDKLVSK